MKNSKLLLVLAASATLTLAACNNQNDHPASSESKSISTSVAEKYAVTVTAHDLLNISVDKAEAEEGERVVITVTPKKASVMLDAVKVNGVDLNAVEGVYAFNMPANAVTVSAEAHDRKAVLIDNDMLPEGVAAAADKQYADPGEVVEITLTYDETALTIHSVMVNDFFAGQKSDKVFYFVMPEGDANIVVLATQGVNHSVADISEHANVNVPEECVSGAGVSFSFSIDLGYDFADIEIKDAEDNAIAWAFDEEEENMVNFTMPASPVSINVKTSVGLFEIASDKTNKNLYEIAYEDNSGAEPTFVRSNDGHFPFGARIRVLVKDTDEQKFTRLSISSIGQFERAEGAVEGNYLAYYFNMPAHKVGVVVENEDLLHEVIFNKDDAPHFNFSLYMKDEDGNYVPADGAMLFTEAYVKAELVEGYTDADYALSSLKISYKTHTSYYDYDNNRDLLKSSSYTTGLNEDGYYGFTLSLSSGEVMDLEGEDAKVTITAVEKDLQIWKNKSWLGTYRGFEFGSSDGDYVSASTTVTIDGAGEYKGRSGPFLITADDVDNKVVTMHNSTSSSPTDVVFAYGDNLILTHDYPTDTVMGTNGDWFIAVKKADPAEDDSNYTVKAEHFTIGSDTYGAVQFFHNGQAYANAFIEKTGSNYYIDGVTFNFLNGQYVTDDSASYEVLVNGEVIKSIGTKAGSTGYRNRMYLDGAQGSYAITDAEENAYTLVLDGVGNASFDGHEDWIYTLDGANVAITRIEQTALGAVTYNGALTIDTAAKTGTLVSMEHNDPEVLVYDLNSQTVQGAYSSSSYSRGQFTKDEENNQYVVDNIPTGYAVYEMAIQVGLDGKVSFDFKCGQYVSYGTYYVYGTVCKNGSPVSGYDKLGGTSADPEATHVEVVANAGDIIQIAVVSNSSYSSANYKKAIVSNINFAAPGEEVGEYAVSDGKNMKLDGFGNGYTYNAEAGTIAFSEKVHDATNPWFTKTVSYTGSIDIAAKTIEITNTVEGDLQASKYKGYNMYSTGVDTKGTSDLTATFNVSLTNEVTGTKSGAISDYDAEAGTMKVGSQFFYYNKELDIFWTAFGSNGSSVGTDTYIFFNSDVSDIVAVKYGSSNSKYNALLKINYVDGTTRYAFCQTSVIYEDVTFSTSSFPTSNSSSITIYDKNGTQIYSK